MKLDKCLKNILKSKEVWYETNDINTVFIAYHNSDDEVNGIVMNPNKDEIDIVYYLAQGFLIEAEITIMVNTLLSIKEKSFEAYMYLKNMLRNENYTHYDDVFKKIDNIENNILGELRKDVM